MHTAYVSEQTAEHRRQKVEDVRKRSEFRKAHGLEGDKSENVLGGWTVKSDGEVMGPGMKESGGEGPLDREIRVKREEAAREGEFVDFEGKRRPVRKWLGIW